MLATPSTGRAALRNQGIPDLLGTLGNRTDEGGSSRPKKRISRRGSAEESRDGYSAHQMGQVFAEQRCMKSFIWRLLDEVLNGCYNAVSLSEKAASRRLGLEVVSGPGDGPGQTPPKTRPNRGPVDGLPAVFVRDVRVHAEVQEGLHGLRVLVVRGPGQGCHLVAPDTIEKTLVRRV
jgi:hypothetical protein